jgi:hypothetical protein
MFKVKEKEDVQCTLDLGRVCGVFTFTRANKQGDKCFYFDELDSTLMGEHSHLQSA